MEPDPSIESLQRQHAALEAQIMAETGHAYYDSVAVRQMKLEKLRLKEELDRLRRH
ncbi:MULTISPECIES: YdcH family protein [Rhodospirillales]|uniref:DUF465 domain-containing protein n=2 Tax=Rhodospirillales TaxID=204441 RepID=B6IQ61_RHOCS|nr:YdcH family protein [Rhodospirillum centenum]ACI97597.1 conserved hypothetical protein [Rhodospirillum centenum SW]